MATVVQQPPRQPKAFVPEVLGRGDYEIIGEMVADGSRVLDLGCGEGQLMAYLEARKGCNVRGIEISASKVRKSVAKGLSVYQGDINGGLTDYPDQRFDYVVLSQTLQEAKSPRELLREMVRIGRHAIVAFPNFGHWSTRLSLLVTGRAPKTRHLPYDWYDTPNIHFVTIPDFEDLLERERLTVEGSYFLRGDKRVNFRPSLMADTAVYLTRR